MRLTRLIPSAVLCAVALSGCGFHGIYSLPLPGGEGSGGPTYDVKVVVADALDLVPYSSVKVNGASVGTIHSVSLYHRHALLDCRIQRRVHLPANAIARIEQTSLLGEKFLEIESPANAQPVGRLHDGSLIPLSRTDTSATVEEVLGSLAALLNGGGISQVHTIVTELNRVLADREPALRDTVRRLNSFVAALDRQKTEIVGVINGLDDLAGTVRSQEHSLTRAVDAMPPALAVLADSRQRLTHMLTSVDRLGDVTVHLIHASGDDLVTNLRKMRPTLRRLAQVGSVIPKILQLVLTYPVADGVEKAFYGDYGNLHITLDLSRKSLERNFGKTR
jgi:phospholipid/cholesterol/gamma-HCH transport system substrate-binding protein